MALFFGIYGFQITQRTKVISLCLHPRITSHEEAKNLARDQENFNLTAVGELEGAWSQKINDLLYDLSATLTFCEQQWVVITRPIEAENCEQVMAKLPTRLDLPFHRHTTGALLLPDISAPDARRNFLEICMSKLVDEKFNQQTEFRRAFFRNVESWRLQVAFIDLTYYLDFGALEMLARCHENEFRKPFAKVAASFLKKLAYDVQPKNIQNRYLGMQNYADVRNALFHNGKLEKIINENGKQITLRLMDFEGKLRFLVPDVLLKVMGYNDPQINWNRWLDRMPFKAR